MSCSLLPTFGLSCLGLQCSSVLASIRVPLMYAPTGCTARMFLICFLSGISSLMFQLYPGTSHEMRPKKCCWLSVDPDLLRNVLATTTRARILFRAGRSFLFPSTLNYLQLVNGSGHVAPPFGPDIRSGLFVVLLVLMTQSGSFSGQFLSLSPLSLANSFFLVYYFNLLTK